MGVVKKKRKGDFQMYKTKENPMMNNQKLLVDTDHLQELLDCGKNTARKIGTAAGARRVFGKCVLWHVPTIKKYLENGGIE